MSTSGPAVDVDDPPSASETEVRPRDGAVTGPLAWLAVLALVFSAAVGANLFGLRDDLAGSGPLQPKAPAASRVADGPAPEASPPRPETLVRSQPWWQAVTTLEGGQGTTTSRLVIDAAAMQWRVRGLCQSGRLVVTVAGGRKPVLEAPCTGAEMPLGYGTKAGAMELKVTSDAPWKLQVDQQVDVPLEEEPLPSMSAPGTAVVATGDFYRMDQTGKGSITVFRLADGSHALRLDDFYVSPNVDLEITLSPLEAPRTTEEFMGTPWAKAAPLDITAGSLNFIVPRDVDPTKYESVVIWCPLINSAYAAATLKAA